ncbi:MAG: ribonuclease P protein component [Planctomycetes bacterium]|nr:ribonuclease P protein component [Planctomycetota bacterium]
MPTFRKHEHLRTPAEFDRVYARRRSAASTDLIIYALENDLAHSRIGLSVSKKFGGAVQRNRLRRLYREAYRLSRDQLPVGLDLVLIPRTKLTPALDELRKSIVKLVKQLHKKLRKELPAEEAKPAEGEGV